MDTQTLFIAQTAGLAATAATLWASRSEADTHNGMRLWTHAVTVQAAAYIVLSGIFHWPAVVGAVIGNFAGALSVALFFAAIRRFVGQPVDWRWLGVMIAVVTVCGGIAGEHYVAGAAMSGIIYAGFELSNACALWRSSLPGLGQVRRLVSALYVAMGLVLPIRACALLLTSLSATAPDMSRAWQAPLYLFGFIYIVVTNFGFLTMCKARAEAELRIQALTDALTGLANRRALDDAIGKSLASSRRNARPFAVVIADIDHFKAINDERGHAAGDVALAAFGQRLQAALRAGDRAFRYGGEEFYLLLPDTDEAGARTLAERVRAHIAAAPDDAGRPLTASFGVACWRVEDDALSLVERADQAVYKAKALGRDRVEVG